MSRVHGETRPETALVVGGAIAMLGVAGQFLSLYGDSDLSTPIGRFRAMSEGLNHLAPVLGASALLLAGSWNSDETGRRAAVAACLILIAVLSLLAIPTILPDARQIASGVVPFELNRFRTQVVRALLYLVGTAVLLGIGVWKFLRRTPLTTP